MLTEADGGPVAVVITGANVHDSLLLQDALEAVIVEPPDPREHEQNLCLDKAFSGEPSEATARAKLQVSKAGRHIGQEAIQLHGGIGMTAEYSVGHLTARLTAIDHLLGDGRQQVKNLSRRLTSYDVVEPLP